MHNDENLHNNNSNNKNDYNNDKNNIPNTIVIIDIITQHIDATTIQFIVPMPLRPLLLRLPECVGNIITITSTISLL